MKLLHSATNIQIRFDSETNILFCNWMGLQNEDLLKQSGSVIHKLLKQKKCCKILNDNTNVQGHWYHSAEWTAKEWFPLMTKAGLKHFAWVCSRDIFAQLSAQRALPGGRIVKVFHSYDVALEWLIKQS